jgi:hypothetical protein
MQHPMVIFMGPTCLIMCYGCYRVSGDGHNLLNGFLLGPPVNCKLVSSTIHIILATRKQRGDSKLCETHRLLKILGLPNKLPPVASQTDLNRSSSTARH